jgi:hypothetical protein
METLFVPKIQAESLAAEKIAGLLDEYRVEWQAIGCANWEDQYPYKPDVRFRMAHTGGAILLEYEVSEACVRALAQDNGRVWEDACCECFVQMDEGDAYYNIECNCAGRILVGAGADRHHRTWASQAVLDRIDRYSSLGSSPFDERPCNSPWRLALLIPVSTFFLHKISGLGGRYLRANFYKCGDLLSKPHFLSWQPITLPKPDFHQPSFFGLLKME